MYYDSLDSDRLVRFGSSEVRLTRLVRTDIGGHLIDYPHPPNEGPH